MSIAYPFWWIVDTVLFLLLVAVIISAVLSWLVAFNVINTHNQFVYSIMQFLYRLTEPLLRPIRRFVPTLGGVDISPLILILLIQFVRMLWQALFFAGL